MKNQNSIIPGKLSDASDSNAALELSLRRTPPKIQVTEPFLPPLNEFVESLERIWESKWLTNNGQFHQELEARLAEYLGVEYVSLFSNGTIALVTALQALRITGEVITTPYSFVATAHSLLWNNLHPVFCDIDPDTFNINPDKIEALITPNTTAIMPVHCYGVPCNVERIRNIADRYGLKVIYDAAHAFGVNVAGTSILRHGDLSVLSFHATKVFNTIEGGAIISKDAVTKQRIDYLKNFGFADETTIVAPGINGKMNEVQAAFGLIQLKHMQEILSKREAVDHRYRERLNGVEGVSIPEPIGDFTRNYSYFPVLIDETVASRDDVYTRMKEKNILARRYFFPLISDMPMYRGLASANESLLPVAQDVSARVLCLPIHPNLSIGDVDWICKVLQRALKPQSVEVDGDTVVNGIEAELVSLNNVYSISAISQTDVPLESQASPLSISIVIPVYKAEKYLAQCLDSIFNSTFKGPIEVIAVNDGSPDQSGMILEEYAGRHPNLVVITQENRGGAPAINRGLRMAKNDYVMIIDCDDWLDTSALEILLSEAGNTNAEVVAGKIIKTYPDRTEPAYDTAYIQKSETVSIDSRPSIFQDGMYLGKIFSRKMLNVESIQMDPTLLYADRPFVNVAMAQAINVRLVPVELYFWRQREDAKNLSVTDQMHLAENLKDRVRSIRVIRDELKARGKHRLLKVVDEHNLKRLFWHFNKSSPASLRTFAEICRPYIRLVDLEKNKNLTDFQRTMARMILKTKPAKFPMAFYLWFAKQQTISTFNKAKSNINKVKSVLNRSLNGSRLERITKDEAPDPLLIVFESFFGKSYGGQPRYIYEQLLKSNKAFRAVWVYQGKEKLKDIPGPVIQVHRGTTEYFHYLARARYWVNNIRFSVTYKPPHTTYLQTWHGTPLKRLGLDIEVAGPEAAARKDFLAEAAQWDYLMAANDFSEEKFRSAFNFKGKYLTGGYPANDVFHHPEALEELASATRDALGLPQGKKVVLYAPTWRDDTKIGSSWNYRFDLRIDLARMQEQLGDDYCILLRMHHLIANKLDLTGVKDFAFDVSKYPDPAGLMAVADVMVSDYSSIFFDYANLGRPIIFYMYDLEKYSNNLRGFYLDPQQELPGPIVTQFADLVEAIRNSDRQQEVYQERMQTFFRKFCALEDGRSAQRAVETVFTELPEIEGVEKKK